MTQSIAGKTGSKTAITKGTSVCRDEAAAAAELAEQIHQPNASLAVVFASSHYDLGKLGPCLKDAFGDCPVVGCSTAGEITDHGYGDHSLTGFAIADDETLIDIYTLSSLSMMSAADIQGLAENVARQMAAFKKQYTEASSFALFLVDGLSGLEERVVAQVHGALGEIPLVGGSAGDDLAFEHTAVLVDGEFRSDTAVISLFNTTLPFSIVKTQHFVPTEIKLVITESDPGTRIVYEINGEPADKEYARLVGVDINDLGPDVFSQYPIMLKIGGEYFVRSIQRRNDDGSLKFYCAIDTGLVLTVARGVDIVQNLQKTLDQVSAGLNDVQLLITCECVLRRVEVLKKDYTALISDVLKQHQAIGFHSYGEQTNSIHVNQTFTGVMIGSRS